ncbi:right-handed parallel beta-helix repeat-containing protein [Mariniflexile ostreae]|uniref:Right-handed parallel beta-helix repeat-containing protein n=1 Tax=Mariniflexile ostreae TaxID=1520892 RepID=A0ABV5FDX1_9FLAO
MKKMIKNMLPALLLIITLASCNTEDLYVESVTQSTTDIEKEEDIGLPEGEALDITTPCDYALDQVEPNSTLIINCVLDLKGQTVTLPANVTIEYQGGEVINGTLNFSQNTTIDSGILNQSLEIGGAKPSVKDTSFDFIPSKWGIVEGKVTSEVALRNRDILESTMNTVKNLGINTFSIGKMDAYFEVSKVTSTTTNQNFYPSTEAINIPSDFNLEMADNTILRVFPTTNKGSASLLAIADASNVTVKGGVLYGDRDLRQYDKANAEDGALLFTIRSGKNIILDGIKFTMSSRTALTINSFGFTFNPDYNPGNNITVRNCLFERNRGMACSITDGHNILVESNTFIDTAQPTKLSDGGVVGFAINIEPVRTRNVATGELVYYQNVYDVTIKNNTEINSRIGAFNIYLGDNILIEGNNIDTGVGYTFATNCKIYNNDFVQKIAGLRPAILAGGAGETVFGNEISNNSILGYGVGIAANHKNVNIFNNKINDCKIGIQLKQSTNMKIYGNSIKNIKTASKGITAHIAEVNDVDIYNNDIDVVTNPLYFVQLNKLSTSAKFNVKVYSNKLSNSNNGALSFSNANGVDFYNNSVKGGLQLGTVQNFKISNNTITSYNKHGIHLTKSNSNVQINLNKTTVEGTNTRFQCIKNETIGGSNIILSSNNVCI